MLSPPISREWCLDLTGAASNSHSLAIDNDAPTSDMSIIRSPRSVSLMWLFATAVELAWPA